MNYDPDLDVRENPHYFQINHVLFNAHSFRMQRLKHKFEDGSWSLVLGVLIHQMLSFMNMTLQFLWKR